MNVLNNSDKTDREYSLAPMDDLISLWGSNIKVTAGCRGGEDIHLDAGASKYIFLFVLILC